MMDDKVVYPNYMQIIHMPGHTNSQEVYIWIYQIICYASFSKIFSFLIDTYRLHA